MRIFFCMALMLCCAMTVFAQNDKISYQAVVRGTDNHLVVNTDMTITVSLANSEDGAAVYTEAKNITVDGGTITGNTATAGGAIGASASGSRLTFTNPMSSSALVA